jgi:hypothetical protein
MENTKIHYGKLTFNYASDENSYHCTCACGNKVILTKAQLESMSSCGCETRNLLSAASGKSADEIKEDEKMNLPAPTPVAVSEESGVRFENSKNKWRVRVTFHGKEYHLGYYEEKDAALAIRREANLHLNGDFLLWYNEVYKRGR